MSWSQLKAPNLNQTDYPGWCLRFVQSAFGTDHKFECATDQWNASRKHTDALPNVAVPVYFSWFGTIDGVYKDWGDVAIYVPGRSAPIFGTPMRGGGKSNRWDTSVESRAVIIGGKYLGWSEDLAGQTLVQSVPDAPQAPPAQAKTSMVRLMGDYRTLRNAPGGAQIARLAPNNYGGHLDYPILERSGDFVKIPTQMFGQGWVYVGADQDVDKLTQYFDA